MRNQFCGCPIIYMCTTCKVDAEPDKSHDVCKHCGGKNFVSVTCSHEDYILDQMEVESRKFRLESGACFCVNCQGKT
jgi:DNA-directed RNA polymerase subunit RPC12/RpoP